MSGWGLGWFGGGGGGTTAKKKDAPKSAILQLRGTLDMLNKREKHLQNQMDEQEAIARKYVKSNAAAAKAALRRKQAFNKSREQTANQIITVEQEISTIETANINKETYDAMQKAGAAMKQIHNNLTPDKVDQAMEDLREQHAIGEEIAEALTQGAGANALDEDELDQELADMQQEQLDSQMLKTGTVPVGGEISRLPAVATGELPTEEEEDEEAELRKLQAEMAM